MTRLTPDAIKDVPDGMANLDSTLMGKTGMDLRGIACAASGIKMKDISFSSWSVAVVPITSGKGTISGFSRSVAAAVRNIGMNVFVTESSDVTGIAEAVSMDADIIFMADDERFIALNTHTRTYSDNIWSTARGFVTALGLAEGSLKGKKVLVVGAGRVGGEAVRMLLDDGAHVEVTDVIPSKAKSIESRHKNVKAIENVDDAISKNNIIFNASPGAIPGHLVQKGAVISSPGVPYAFDELGESNAKLIIHDVLSIGVAVMAVSSASKSIYNIQESECAETTAAIS